MAAFRTRVQQNVTRGVPYGEYVVKCPAGEGVEQPFCLLDRREGVRGMPGLIICQSLGVNARMDDLRSACCQILIGTARS
jgi:hypothetical protein